jgi:peptidyl-prolyl cis-trans isomerase SurA
MSNSNNFTKFDPLTGLQSGVYILVKVIDYMRKFSVAISCFIFLFSFANAQRKAIDQVAGVVGNAIILDSDIEQQYAQYLYNGNPPDESIKCQILQQLLTQKLLTQQAIIDSVFVNDDDVESETDRRMRIMTQRAGGQERLEQFIGKSIIQYKEEMRPEIKEQLVAQRMQGKITEKVSVTPLDVKKFFQAIPKDSLPTYNKEVEVGEIVFEPKLTKEEKEVYKDKAEALRLRIKAGEDFGNMARLYSQDPGSAPEGGDLGFFERETMVKEFSATAFKLKAGELSQVFETEHGFHFLQVIERRGEQVRARHILITTMPTEASLERAKAKADSVKNILLTKKVDFSTAASFYSDNKETKYNGGMLLNAENVQNRSTIIPTDKLDPQIALIVDTMKVGEVAGPVLYTAANGKQSYNLLYLKSKTDAHKANLEQDFAKIKEVVYEDKINKALSEWFEKRRKETYIKVDEQYHTCEMLQSWFNSPVVSVN